MRLSFKHTTLKQTGVLAGRQLNLLNRCRVSCRFASDAKKIEKNKGVTKNGLKAGGKKSKSSDITLIDPIGYLKALPDNVQVTQHVVGPTESRIITKKGFVVSSEISGKKGIFLCAKEKEEGIYKCSRMKEIVQLEDSSDGGLPDDISDYRRKDSHSNDKKEDDSSKQNAVRKEDLQTEGKSQSQPATKDQTNSVSSQHIYLNNVNRKSEKAVKELMKRKVIPDSKENEGYVLIKIPTMPSLANDKELNQTKYIKDLKKKLQPAKPPTILYTGVKRSSADNNQEKYAADLSEKIRNYTPEQKVITDPNSSSKPKRIKAIVKKLHYAKDTSIKRRVEEEETAKNIKKDTEDILERESRKGLQAKSLEFDKKFEKREKPTGEAVCERSGKDQETTLKPSTSENKNLKYLDDNINMENSAVNFKTTNECDSSEDKSFSEGHQSSSKYMLGELKGSENITPLDKMVRRKSKRKSRRKVNLRTVPLTKIMNKVDSDNTVRGISDKVKDRSNDTVQKLSDTDIFKKEIFNQIKAKSKLETSAYQELLKRNMVSDEHEISNDEICKNKDDVKSLNESSPKLQNQLEVQPISNEECTTKIQKPKEQFSHTETSLKEPLFNEINSANTIPPANKITQRIAKVKQSKKSHKKITALKPTHNASSTCRIEEKVRSCKVNDNVTTDNILDPIHNVVEKASLDRFHKSHAKTEEYVKTEVVPLGVPDGLFKTTSAKVKQIKKSNRKVKAPRPTHFTCPICRTEEKVKSCKVNDDIKTENITDPMDNVDEKASSDHFQKNDAETQHYVKTEVVPLGVPNRLVRTASLGSEKRRYPFTNGKEIFDKLKMNAIERFLNWYETINEIEDVYNKIEPFEMTVPDVVNKTPKKYLEMFSGNMISNFNERKASFVEDMIQAYTSQETKDINNNIQKIEDEQIEKVTPKSDNEDPFALCEFYSNSNKPINFAVIVEPDKAISCSENPLKQTPKRMIEEKLRENVDRSKIEIADIVKTLSLEHPVSTNCFIKKNCITHSNETSIASKGTYANDLKYMSEETSASKQGHETINDVKHFVIVTDLNKTKHTAVHRTSSGTSKVAENINSTINNISSISNHSSELIDPLEQLLQSPHSPHSPNKSFLSSSSMKSVSNGPNKELTQSSDTEEFVTKADLKNSTIFEHRFNHEDDILDRDHILKVVTVMIDNFNSPNFDQVNDYDSRSLSAPRTAIRSGDKMNLLDLEEECSFGKGAQNSDEISPRFSDESFSKKDIAQKSFNTGSGNCSEMEIVLNDPVDKLDYQQNDIDMNSSNILSKKAPRKLKQENKKENLKQCDYNRDILDKSMNKESAAISIDTAKDVNSKEEDEDSKTETINISTISKLKEYLKSKNISLKNIRSIQEKTTVTEETIEKLSHPNLNKSSEPIKDDKKNTRVIKKTAYVQIDKPKKILYNMSKRVSESKVVVNDNNEKQIKVILPKQSCTLCTSNMSKKKSTDNLSSLDVMSNQGDEFNLITLYKKILYG